MKFKIFISSVKNEFAKASLAITVVAASAMFPIAAIASPTFTGVGVELGRDKGAAYDFVSAPEAPFKMPDVPVGRVPAREFPITDYGAVTGTVKNTAAFAKAIAACSAACSAAGGGRVKVS